MKNIYILGTPRSGKSTLASMIKDKFPQYTIISMEAVRNGFIKSLPNLEMQSRYSEARINVFPEFIIEFANWNKKLNKNKYGSIIEGSLVDAKSAKKLLNDDDIVIFLGHNNLSNDEIIQNIIKYTKDNDYTFNWSYDKIKSHFGNINEQENENINICQDEDYIYVDTTKNREEVLNILIDKLEKIINDKE